RALSGGGGARLLVARGISPHVTLAAGGEVGGSGTLDPSAEDTENLDASIHLAAPLALRLVRFSRMLDLQVAPVFRFNQGEKPLPPGIRGSIGIGVSTMRKGAFMPFVVVWLGYEGHGLFNDEQASHSFRIGTRVGVDWDLGQR
ncbi:MAG: hypothetical protein OXU20_29065, partial [Myxococcales bacterium]|nr:hypothetical protein [Myxococcales bacterium]